MRCPAFTVAPQKTPAWIAYEIMRATRERTQCRAAVVATCQSGAPVFATFCNKCAPSQQQRALLRSSREQAKFNESTNATQEAIITNLCTTEQCNVAQLGAAATNLAVRAQEIISKFQIIPVQGYLQMAAALRLEDDGHDPPSTVAAP